MAHTRIGQIRECPQPRGGGPCLIFGAKWIVCNRDLSSFFGVSEIFNCIFFAENHLDVTLDPWIWILDYVAEEIYNEDIVLLVRGEEKGEVGGGGLAQLLHPSLSPSPSPSHPLSVPGVEMQVSRELKQQRWGSTRQVLANFSGVDIEVQKKKRKVVLCSRPP